MSIFYPLNRQILPWEVIIYACFYVIVLVRVTNRTDLTWEHKISVPQRTRSSCSLWDSNRAQCHWLDRTLCYRYLLGRSFTFGFNSVYAHVSLSVCHVCALGGWKRASYPWSHSGRKSWVTWMLGIEMQFSRRVAMVLNTWAIFSDPIQASFATQFFNKVLYMMNTCYDFSWVMKS